MKKKLGRKAKPHFGRGEYPVKGESNTRTTRYRCKECGEEFDRVVEESDEGNKVTKHWTKGCLKCGGRNIKVVREQVSKKE